MARIRKKRNLSKLYWKQKNPDYYLYRRSKRFVEVERASRYLSLSGKRIIKQQRAPVSPRGRRNSHTHAFRDVVVKRKAARSTTPENV